MALNEMISNLASVLGGDNNSPSDADPPNVTMPPSAPPDLGQLVPTIPTLEQDDPLKTPVHEHPAFIQAVGKIWNAQALGQTEQNFIVNSRKPDGTPIIKFQPGISGRTKEEFTIQPNTTAIVHTHPPTSDPDPSPNDKDIAEKQKVAMYTIGRDGLYLYSPKSAGGSGKTVQVVKGLDFLKRPSLTKTLGGR